jgi:hypothetical protein
MWLLGWWYTPRNRMSEQFHLPYRWIFPIAQFLICVLALWPIRSELALEIRATVRGYGAAKAVQQEPNYVLPYSFDLNIIDPQWERSYRNKQRRLWTPTLLDIPVGLLVIPYAIHNPARTEWTPNGMDFKTWRAISWPFIGIIFWWIAGRGVEALLAAGRGAIHPLVGWIETAIGVVLLVSGFVILITPLCVGDSDVDIPLIFICGSGALWAAFGGSIVAARIAQRGIRIRLRDAISPDSVPS